MKSVTRLYTCLEATNSAGDTTEDANVVVAVLRSAFESSSREDLPWLLAFVLGKGIRRVLTTARMRLWAIQESGIPEWLFADSHAIVGDIVETISLVVHGDDTYAEEPLCDFMQFMDELAAMRPDEQHAWVTSHWRTMSPDDSIVFNKILSGRLRIRVAKGLVLRALGEALGVDPAALAHRLQGEWNPHTLRYEHLTAPDDALLIDASPYPFCLASPLDVVPSALGDITRWQAEWKWNGIRVQIILRNGELFIWTRDDELVTDRYPDLHGIVDIITNSNVLHDGLVLDGVIVAYKNGVVLPFAELQRRITRKVVSRSIIRDVPVAIMGHDILEHDGVDMRTQPLASRRALLEMLIPHANAGSHGNSAKADARFVVSPIVHATTWNDLAAIRARARTVYADGLVLKRLDSPYTPGRKRGDWWNWKVDPHTIVAVLVYAQSDTGTASTLPGYIDYTFAVWNDDELIPIAKTFTGLTSEAKQEVDAYIRKNTLEKFGPVRTVKPELVFELSFEGIERSTRHKSGIVVSSPRILSRHFDRNAEDADTIETVLALLHAQEIPP